MCAFVYFLCSRLCSKCYTRVISSLCESVRAVIIELVKDFPGSRSECGWKWQCSSSGIKPLVSLHGKELGLLNGCVLGEKPLLHSAVLISCHKLFSTLTFIIFGGCHSVVKTWTALSLISKPQLTREPQPLCRTTGTGEDGNSLQALGVPSGFLLLPRSLALVSPTCWGTCG